jgi:hypothetical protein
MLKMQRNKVRRTYKKIGARLIKNWSKIKRNTSKEGKPNFFKVHSVRVVVSASVS